MPRTKIVAKCCHCKIRRFLRGRGLCWKCFEDLKIRASYSRCSKHDAAMQEIVAPWVPPPRRPSDPTHQCLWCGKWRQWGPLQVCQTCHREHLERAKTMPEDDEPLAGRLQAED